MVTKVAHEFLTFWHEARGEGLVPLSTDIHLERLEAIGAKVMYNVWDDEGGLFIRYMGSDVVEAFGADATGADQMSYSHPDEIEVSRLSLGLIGGLPCGIAASITLRAEDLAPREFECIYLPVEHQGRNIHMIELVNPLSIDYRPEDEEGVLQALRYENRHFIDIGAGVPPAEGLLAAYGVCKLKDLMES